MPKNDKCDMCRYFVKTIRTGFTSNGYGLWDGHCVCPDGDERYKVNNMQKACERFREK